MNKKLDTPIQNIINALQIKENESFTILFDNSTKEIASQLIEKTSSFCKKVYTLDLEEYRKENDKEPRETITSEKKETHILNALKKTDAMLFCAKSFPDELPIRRNIIRFCQANKIRYAHAPNLSEEILLTGLSSDIDKCNIISKEVYETVKNAKKLRIITKNGTDLRIILSPSYKWIKSDWDFTKEWHNIPSGEVFTAPYNTEGTAVIDGTLGNGFDIRYGSLEKSPMIWHIKNNKVIGISCKNREIGKEFSEYMKKYNAYVIGEIGIGTLDVDRLINRMIQDEKKLGTVHIAIGHNYHEKTGAKDLNQITHCDGIILNPTLYSDKTCILNEGLYCLDKQDH
jgi:aminopeptidase